MPSRLPASLLLLLLSVLALWPSAAHAQRVDAPVEEGVGEVYDAPRGRPVRIAMGAIGMRLSLDEGRSISEVVVPVRVAVPVTDRIGVAAQTRYVTVGGDGLTKLTGLADVQVGASAQLPLGGANVVASLSGSVPLGDRQLEPGAFATAALLSRDDLALDVPSLGQGPRLAPGLSVAVPAGPGFAVGFGVSALVSSAYQPFAGEDLDYAPATEYLVTAGFSAGTSAASDFSVDATFVAYGDDTFGGRTYRPGNKLVGTMQWTRGRWNLLLRGRYLQDGSRQDSVDVAPARPVQGLLSTGLRVGPQAFSVGLIVGARYYGDFRSTESSSGEAELIDTLGKQQLLFEGGLAPSVALGPKARLNLTAGYTLGIGTLVDIGDIPPLEGFRVGGGLAFEL